MYKVDHELDNAKLYNKLGVACDLSEKNLFVTIKWFILSGFIFTLPSEWYYNISDSQF